MMKRLLSVLLAAVLLLALLPTALVSAEETPTLIEYPVEGGSLYFDPTTQTVESADKTITAIDLPSEIGGVAVKKLKSGLFYCNDTLRSLKIAAGVDLIDESAFAECTALEEVTLLGVKTVGWRAFADCPKLKTLTLAGVEVLEYNAFSYCTSLETVALPDGLRVIGSEAFAGCAAMTELPSLPTSLEQVDGAAFYKTAAWDNDESWSDELLCKDGWLLYSRNNKRETVSVPDGIRGIAGSAFSQHEILLSVRLPEGVECIGEAAFLMNSRLKKVTFPASLKAIGRSAFLYCTDLTSACFLGDAPSIGQKAFYDDYKDSFSSATKTLPIKNLTLYYLPARTGWTAMTEYVTAPWDGNTIPTGNMTYKIDGGELYFELETGTVSGVSGTLTHLELPEKINGSYVRRIAANAFAGQTELTTVTLPESVFVLGDSAFSGCTALRTVKLPQRMQSIGRAAFCDCSALQSVTLPQGLTTVPYRAFRDCKSLNYVSIPDGVTSIIGEAFRGCSLLTRLSFPESLTEINIEAFCGCLALENLTLPSKLETIGEYAFASCNALKTVTIPASVRYMYLSFADCKALREVYFLGDEPTNANTAFAGCTDITIYYTEGKDGWTTPEWNGYPAYPIPHKHSFTSQVVAPTCTADGYTLESCACGESRKTNEVKALGHSYKDGVCTRCGQRDPDAKPTVSFVDIPEKAWYRSAVEYAVEHELMNGVGDGKFNPEGSMTRAMLVTVLWRNAGAPKTESSRFTDVPSGRWFSTAVAWAAECGVVNGVGDGKFDPDGAITREQMAAILFRYADNTKVSTEKRGDFAQFADAGKVSRWAKEALSWTVAENIIGGSKEGGKLYLDPQGNATRAQVAAILMRYLEKTA